MRKTWPKNEQGAKKVREGDRGIPLGGWVKMLIWSQPFGTYLKGLRASRCARTHVHTSTSVKLWAPNYVNLLLKEINIWPQVFWRAGKLWGAGGRKKMKERKKYRGERETGGGWKKGTEGGQRVWEGEEREPRGREDLSSFITDKSSYRSQNDTMHVYCGARCAHTLRATLGKKHSHTRALDASPS